MATEYITGLREVVRSLEQIGDAVTVRDELKDVFTPIGHMVQIEASRLAPRRSGALAASIKPSKTKNKAAVRAGSAKVPYAGAINYGWAARHIGAKNFLQRAIDSKKDQAIKMMDEGLGRIIEKYMGSKTN